MLNLWYLKCIILPNLTKFQLGSKLKEENCKEGHPAKVEIEIELKLAYIP